MTTKAVIISPTATVPIKGAPLESMLTELTAPVSGRPPLNVGTAYDAVPWVYRCVQLRAQSVSSIPFAITDATGQPAAWPWASDLPDLLARLCASLDLYGGGYVFKAMNRARVLRALAFVAFNTVTIHYDPAVEGGIAGYSRQLGEEAQDLTPDEMVAVFLPDASIECGPGRSPAEVALSAAGLLRSQNDFAQSFFERGAIPAVVVTVEGNPPDEDMDRLERWWKRLLTGARGAWESVFVRAGIKPQVIGQPVKDLAMPELMGQARQQIAVSFGVPEDYLTTGASNYATAREHRVSFWRDTIIPQAKLIEAALNRQLFAPSGLAFRFLYENLEAMQQDEATKATAMVQLVKAGVITTDEARAMLGIAARVAETSPATATEGSAV